jgi:uncharacterized protein
MRPLQALILAGVAFWTASGCGDLNLLPGRTFHQRCGWRAEDYFTDPKVVALCKAIEANDLAEMERLVRAGVDVNAEGKGKMTPLLWAFPDNHLPRFEWLLEKGANPNIVVESEFNTRGFISPGDAVTHMVCKTAFHGYFDAVFQHGGDPHLRNSGPGKHDDVPLTLAIKWGPRDRAGMIRVLIDAGADPNDVSTGYTPAMQAVSWFGQYGLARLLLDLGADHKVYERDGMRRLIHIVVREEDALRGDSPRLKAEYQALLAELVRRGESIELARKDLQHWESWSRTTGEYKRRMDAAVAERKAGEGADPPGDAKKPSEPTDAADSR